MSEILAHPTMIAGSVFFAVTGLLLAIGSIVASRSRTINQRLRALGKRKVTAPKSRRGLFALLTSNQADRSGSSTPLAGSEAVLDSALQHRLAAAGLFSANAQPLFVAAQFLAASLLGGAALLAAGVFKAPLLLLSTAPVVAAILGACLPLLWLERRQTQRRTALRKALPDFLDLIVACLGGGLSVQASLRKVSDELHLAHPDLSSELSVVLGEIGLGRTLDHALMQLAARTQLEELRTLYSFVHQTTKFGTTMVDALNQLAEMLRIQREQRAEERAQKAAVKILFPTLLFIFPTVFVIVAGPAAIQIKQGLAKSHSKETAQGVAK